MTASFLRSAARALLAAALAVAGLPALAHTSDCKDRSGLDLARCERHLKMYAKCGPLAGEAHYACDREFLMANPIDCAPLEGAGRSQCEAEGKALRDCAPKQGSQFIRCVRDEAKASPMGR